MGSSVLMHGILERIHTLAFASICILTLFMPGCTDGGERMRLEGMSEDAVGLVGPEDARFMMNEQQVVVLDVRTQEEYDEGHICNAILLTSDEINGQSAAAVVPSKDSTVLVYCRTGIRSAEAAQKLVNLGYTEVFDLEGGISAWPYDVCAEERGDESTVENDELPVGVKVVCGKTRALPGDASE